MLPLKDLNPTRRVPFVTYALIAVNVVIFLWEQTQSTDELQRAFLQLSVVPAEVLRNPFAVDTFLDFFRSMFFHGGWLHGDNIEDRLGAVGYLGFYFLSGIAASTAQILIDPDSTIPMIGASGAIAGVLGGYLIMYPQVRVQGIILLGLFSRSANWPAWSVLGLWFVIQLFNGLVSLGVTTISGGVAFFAHIGGFVAGIVMIAIFLLLFPQPPASERREVLYERAQRYRY
jgi:membrane associated rhomboid family serine protease